MLRTSRESQTNESKSLIYRVEPFENKLLEQLDITIIKYLLIEPNKATKTLERKSVFRDQNKNEKLAILLFSTQKFFSFDSSKYKRCP